MSRSKRRPVFASGQKRVSQHFLSNRPLLRRIIGIGGITSNDLVIEIGTGKGHLTMELAKRARMVHSIEIDPKLHARAMRQLTDVDNVDLIRGDFLRYRLPMKGRYKVFANIPFHLTTRIVERITNAPNPPDDVWLIMEKGAAFGFCGSPVETDRSLRLKTTWDLSIRYHFRRKDFHPPPSVDCVLLNLKRKRQPDMNSSDLNAFCRFVKHSQRYGLYGPRKLLTKKQISTALKRAELPPIPTDGQLLYVQWLALFWCYRQTHQNK